MTSTPADLGALARMTPAGPVDLPLVAVALRAGVEAAASVDPDWLSEVDCRRAAARQAAVAAGRGAALEAALHDALVAATGAAGLDDDGRVASGARLWLLSGAIASALSGAEPDPFRAWATLLAAGWWPIGPSGGRLVVSTL